MGKLFSGCYLSLTSPHTSWRHRCIFSNLRCRKVKCRVSITQSYANRLAPALTFSLFFLSPSILGLFAPYSLKVPIFSYDYRPGTVRIFPDNPVVVDKNTGIRGGWFQFVKDFGNTRKKEDLYFIPVQSIVVWKGKYTK